MFAEGAQQPLLKPGGVGAAFGGGNNIDETTDSSLVPYPPAQGNINFAFTFHVGELGAPVLPQHGHGFGE